MTDTTKQFMQFIALVVVLGTIGALIANAGLSSSYALPFALVWIFAFLAGVGFIIDGGKGAKALVSRTALAWGLMISAAALIAWLVAARFG